MWERFVLHDRGGIFFGVSEERNQVYVKETGKGRDIICRDGKELLVLYYVLPNDITVTIVPGDRKKYDRK